MTTEDKKYYNCIECGKLKYYSSEKYCNSCRVMKLNSKNMQKTTLNKFI